jgi:hypothetical protein
MEYAKRSYWIASGKNKRAEAQVTLWVEEENSHPHARKRCSN